MDAARAAPQLRVVALRQRRPLEEISRLVGHSSTAVTELVYRKQIRPVLQAGATVMDRRLLVEAAWSPISTASPTNPGRAPTQRGVSRPRCSCPETTAAHSERLRGSIVRIAKDFGISDPGPSTTVR